MVSWFLIVQPILWISQYAGILLFIHKIVLRSVHSDPLITKFPMSCTLPSPVLELISTVKLISFPTCLLLSDTFQHSVMAWTNVQDLGVQSQREIRTNTVTTCFNNRKEFQNSDDITIPILQFFWVHCPKTVATEKVAHVICRHTIVRLGTRPKIGICVWYTNRIESNRIVRKKKLYYSFALDCKILDIGYRIRSGWYKNCSDTLRPRDRRRTWLPTSDKL